MATWLRIAAARDHTSFSHRKELFPYRLKAGQVKLDGAADQYRGSGLRWSRRCSPSVQRRDHLRLKSPEGRLVLVR